MNVRYFFVKERIANGELKDSYMPTERMLADILTKPMQGKLFVKLRERLLGLAIDSNSECVLVLLTT